MEHSYNLKPQLIYCQKNLLTVIKVSSNSNDPKVLNVNLIVI